MIFLTFFSGKECASHNFVIFRHKHRIKEKVMKGNLELNDFLPKLKSFMMLFSRDLRCVFYGLLLAFFAVLLPLRSFHAHLRETHVINV